MLKSGPSCSHELITFLKNHMNFSGQTIFIVMNCINQLSLKFLSLPTLSENNQSRIGQDTLTTYVSVDEQIIPFTGKLSIKQYIKGKPYPWGIKIVPLCGQSGILYDFVLYQGTETELPENILKKHGFGATIVLHFSMNNLEKNGHHGKIMCVNLHTLSV